MRRRPGNEAHYWRVPRSPGLSLLRADFTSHAYPPHTHDALVVAVTEQGGSIIKSRGRVEEARNATLFVFNPAEPHAGWMGWSTRWRYRSLYLTQQMLDRLADALGIGQVPYFTGNLLQDVELVERFLRLHRALEQDCDALREDELLAGTFGCLFQRHGSGGGRIGPAPRDRRLFERVADRMRDEFARPLGLDDLAAGVDLTTFQLIGLFKRATGLTPHAYLTQVRLGMACRHLRQGQPIAAVAGAVGFYDQSALSKHFKRCYGITPAQFARAARPRPAQF